MWIGFSAYNRKMLNHHYGYRHLHTMIDRAYRHFADKEKYYIQEEMATTIDWRQLAWLLAAYADIKGRPNIRAAMYWENVTGKLKDDHTLSQEGRKTLKEILKDPYFIGAPATKS